MPANKGNLTSAPCKEKSGNGFAAVTSKKKKRSCVKSKKHCKQYLQLHSEYRSTYTWHEYTGPHQEHTIVRRAPQAPPTSRPTLEPPLPRRKKCPELAYKTHEFITAADGGGIDAVDTNVVADKVREVAASAALPPSQLSKAISRISTEYRLQFAWPRRSQLTNGEAVPPVAAAGGAAGTAGPPRKSLSMGALKQGIAPAGPAPVHKKRPGDVDHKRDGAQASELEPLVGGQTDTVDGVVPEGDEREEDLNEVKITFRSVTKEEKDKENTRKIAPSMTMPPAGRPSSVQARPMHGILQDDIKSDNEKARARKDFLIRHHLDRTTGVGGDGALLPSPTREKLEPVVPRRRDDSKETREEIQPKTKSSPKNSPRTGRSQSLGPMASERRSPKRQPPPRAPSVSKDAKEKEKEQKDKETRDKSGEPERHPRPTAGGRGVRWSIREPSSIQYTTSSTCEPPIPPLPPPPSGPGPTPLHKTRPSPRAHRKPFLATNAPPHRPVLHHQATKPSVSALGATNTATVPITTTGPLQPIRGSLPKNTKTHGASTSAYASDLGRDVTNKTTRVEGATEKLESSPLKKFPGTIKAPSVATERSSFPVVPRIDPPAKASESSSTSRRNNDDVDETPASSGPLAVPVEVVDKHPSKSSSLVDNRHSYRTNAAAVPTANAGLQAMTAEPQVNGEAGTGGESSVATTPQSQSAGSVVSAPITASQVAPWVDDEPVVKSPPEPTRVKSPEQMIMRSPEPVNWTVPLDTGKTFTVTQNVREGEPLTRPHSEAKTWGASSLPSAPQSAPPELAAQHKSQPHSQHSGYKSPESESMSLGSFSGLNGHKDLDSERDSPLPSNVHSTPTPTQSEKSSIVAGVEEIRKDEERHEAAPISAKPVAGTNLRCLEDPIFEFEHSTKSADPGSSSTAAPSSASPATTSSAAPSNVGAPAAQTGYRVLEAESPTETSGDTVPSSTPFGYRVLEAPALSPGSAQRSVASDVLEKARNRFDKFWGKGGPENQA